MAWHDCAEWETQGDIVCSQVCDSSPTQAAPGCACVLAMAMVVCTPAKLSLGLPFRPQPSQLNEGLSVTLHHPCQGHKNTERSLCPQVRAKVPKSHTQKVSAFCRQSGPSPPSVPIIQALPVGEQKPWLFSGVPWSLLVCLCSHASCFHCNFCHS